MIMADIPKKPWLAARIAAGRRAAHPAICPRCGKAVLAGADDDVAALPAVVDAGPVDAATELAGIAAGLNSYAYIGGELSYRTLRWHVRHTPAGTGPYPVHLAHQCESPPNPL